MVQKAGEKDLPVLAELAVLLWNEHSVAELTQEFSQIMASADAQFFIKYDEGRAVGFAQCQLRHDYVEGTTTTPVGYLEGIFVKADCRRKGYAKELLHACEAWAKERGCREFASDCELENEESRRFHRAMQFVEANRIVCFAKPL